MTLGKVLNFRHTHTSENPLPYLQDKYSISLYTEEFLVTDSYLMRETHAVSFKFNSKQY